jgi:hypothetical protein
MATAIDENPCSNAGEFSPRRLEISPEYGREGRIVDKEQSTGKECHGGMIAIFYEKKSYGNTPFHWRRVSFLQIGSEST